MLMLGPDGFNWQPDLSGTWICVFSSLSSTCGQGSLHESCISPALEGFTMGRVQVIKALLGVFR